MPDLPSTFRPPHRPSRQDARRQHDRLRDATQAWRCWYKTARWQKLRWSVLVRDLFTCRMCGTLEVDTSKLHADHVEPHHGDPEKFWHGELRTTCAHCHNSEKQRIERAARVGGGRVESLRPRRL